MTDVPLYSAPPRPRISPAFAASLEQALGVRDFSKGERASLNELLVSMRSQAASEGFPSHPVKLADDDDGPRDDEDMARLKHAKLDGLMRMLDESPHLLSSVEQKLLPRILLEACWDFRPRAGHLKAMPTHFVVAKAEREAALAASSGLAGEALREMDRAQGVRSLAQDAALEALRAESAALSKRADATDSKLDQILSLLTSPSPAKGSDDESDLSKL